MGKRRLDGPQPLLQTRVLAPELRNVAAQGGVLGAERFQLLGVRGRAGVERLYGAKFTPSMSWWPMASESLPSRNSRQKSSENGPMCRESRDSSL